MSGSVVNVFSSTISGNTASGLQAAGSSSVTLRNATVSGNGMLNLPRGGGLLIEGPATANLYYSTVAGNEAMTGGGVNITGSLTLKGSIIGANRAAYSNPDCYSESATMTTQGYNLIHREDCGLVPAATDRVGSDPRLDVLADWGGSTRTRRLLPGSPALDTGDPADFPALDQRAEGRPRHGDLDAVARADIGAHENGNSIFVEHHGRPRRAGRQVQSARCHPLRQHQYRSRWLPCGLRSRSDLGRRRAGGQPGPRLERR